MVSFTCPNCSAELQIDDSLAGRKCLCPECKRRFRIPDVEKSDDSAEEFPFWLQVFCAVVGIATLGLILAAAIGPGTAAVVSTSLVVIGLGVWCRDRIPDALKAIQHRISSLQNSLSDHHTNRPLKAVDEKHSQGAQTAEQELVHSKPQHLKPQSTRSRPTPGDRSDARHVADPKSHTDLVEIQTGRTSSEAQRPRRSTSRFSRWVQGASVADVRFFGVGASVEIRGRRVDDPLLYKLNGQLQTPFDASLVETDLRVAKDSRGAEQLPYWPSYRGCTPRQRCRYLDWLGTGRSTPDTELGYVFIYFYGLERRIIVDQSDHVAVVNEILRLFPIYGHSRSFQRYAGSLLWLALLTAPATDAWTDEVLESAIEATAYWDDDNLSAMLAVYYSRSGQLPVRPALIVAQHDPRSPRSVVVSRQRDRFYELFQHRFNEKFDSGLPLRTAKRDYRLQYRPASQSLMEFQGRYGSIEITFPNVRGIPSQFKPLLELWTSAIDDLRAFDRAERKTDGLEITAQMYEALPPELRVDDHPNFHSWYSVIERYTDDKGWALVPTGELAALSGVAERKRLTKKQSTGLAATAEYMDLCVEPDARESGQSYKWDDFVSVFPREDSGPENLPSYHAASILLRLGMMIAGADGSFDDTELEFITRHLEEQFELSPQESVRLEHLAHLLSMYPTNNSRLAKKLRDLPMGERQVVGEYLIGIAAADGIIARDEVSALKKLFKSLDLSLNRIDELTIGTIQVTGDGSSGEQELVLDEGAIQRIMRETAQVSRFLQSVMVDDDDGLARDASTPGSTLPVQQTEDRGEMPVHVSSKQSISKTDDSHQYAGLDIRYHALLNALVERDSWTHSEIETLARSHRLMPRACIEVVNEWSLEMLDAWLLDDVGDKVHVERSILENLLTN